MKIAIAQVIRGFDRSVDAKKALLPLIGDLIAMVRRMLDATDSRAR
jgi:hypothetical protein